MLRIGRHTRHALLAPQGHLVLAFLPFLLCTGCVGIPLIEHPRTPYGRDVRSLLGPAESTRPIRIGTTTTEQARSALGSPLWDEKSPSGSECLGYKYEVKATRWIGINVVEHKAIFPLIPPYTPANYYLFLEFDATRILRRYSLDRRYGYLDTNRVDLWDAFLRESPEPPP